MTLPTGSVFFCRGKGASPTAAKPQGVAALQADDNKS